MGVVPDRLSRKEKSDPDDQSLYIISLAPSLALPIRARELVKARTPSGRAPQIGA